ncbi:glycosyl transferase family 90 [Mangrovibacterium sp.]|uniref:glycosyl transferase family 90 n=1 Tax=Mangrovibacterium sp. TaxID=1961364 RepID=UPI003565BF7E
MSVDPAQPDDKLYKLYCGYWDLMQRNVKPYYYLKAFARFLMPRAVLQNILERRLGQVRKFDQDYLETRVSYYNKLTEVSDVKDQLTKLADFRLPEKQRVYFFDSYEFMRFFSFRKSADFLFGDIIHVPDYPAFTKSRPIEGDNRNSVLLNLDKVRHFLFIKDPVSFVRKKDMLVGRSNAKQPHRKRFLEMYFGHPLCNLGQINTNENSHKWQVGKMTLREHLNYKFILCLEGFDVATNLKWVMSSNSLAVMPKPVYETWFMEGTLKPNVHYVEIKADYSDLEERLQYFIEHPDEALQIVRNANNYVKQFQNKKQEELISLMVIQKYFEKTGQ